MYQCLFDENFNIIMTPECTKFHLLSTLNIYNMYPSVVCQMYDIWLPNVRYQPMASLLAIPHIHVRQCQVYWFAGFVILYIIWFRNHVEARAKLLALIKSSAVFDDHHKKIWIILELRKLRTKWNNKWNIGTWTLVFMHSYWCIKFIHIRKFSNRPWM